MTMSIAHTFLLSVSVLVLFLAGCNTKATKSSENAEEVAADVGSCGCAADDL